MTGRPESAVVHPRWTALAALVLLAGCFGDSSPETTPPGSDGDAAQALAFLPAHDVLMPCTGCFEPASAVDAQGRIYVAAHRLENVAVSTDGGATFTVKKVPDPPSPSPRGAGASDDAVQVAPWGEVFYHELWSDSGGIAGGGIHIAGSMDGGETWPLNVFVSVRTMPLSRAFTADRQWLAFDGDSTVYLVFNCGASTVICIMESGDRGLTWSESRNVVLPLDHSYPSPAGFPAVGPDGTILVPYFADPRADGQLGARTVRVSSSKDGGRTWTASTVHTHPPEAALEGGGWPESTILADGSWVASWSDADDAMWVAVTHDEGRTWDATTKDPAMTGPIGGHPFLRPRQDGGFDAVWFGDKGVGAGRFDREGTLLSVALSPDEGGGHSDYPFFDHTPDDRIVMPFITPDGDGLRVAITDH
jgi:hypothetical protein